MGILKLQDWLIKQKYHRLSSSSESSDCQRQGGTYTILLKLLMSLLYGKCSQSDEGSKNHFARPTSSKDHGEAKGKHEEAIILNILVRAYPAKKMNLHKAMAVPTKDLD